MKASIGLCIQNIVHAREDAKQQRELMTLLVTQQAESSGLDKVHPIRAHKLDDTVPKVSDDDQDLELDAHGNQSELARDQKAGITNCPATRPC